MPLYACGVVVASVVAVVVDDEVDDVDDDVGGGGGGVCCCQLYPMDGSHAAIPRVTTVTEKKRGIVILIMIPWGRFVVFPHCIACLITVFRAY